MIKIYISNGWFFPNGITSSKDQAKVLKEIGVKGVELHFTSGFAREFSTGTDFANYDFISIHLPKRDWSEAYDEEIQEIIEVNEYYHPHVMVLHPEDHDESFYDKIKNLPIAIENMDKRHSKDSEGVDIQKLKNLIEKYDFKFVLDVQHCYEHDPTMEYAEELYEALKDRVSHFHVSGESKDCIHELVINSLNKEAILNFLKGKDEIIILEGKFTKPEEIKQEIEFLKKEIRA